MAMAEFWKATKILLFGDEEAAPETAPAEKQANQANQANHAEQQGRGDVNMIAPADNDTVTVTYDFRSPQSETRREG